jgi:hypothetical protein
MSTFASPDASIRVHSPDRRSSGTETGAGVLQCRSCSCLYSTALKKQEEAVPGGAGTAGEGERRVREKGYGGLWMEVRATSVLPLPPAGWGSANRHPYSIDRRARRILHALQPPSNPHYSEHARPAGRGIAEQTIHSGMWITLRISGQNGGQPGASVCTYTMRAWDNEPGYPCSYDAGVDDPAARRRPADAPADMWMRSPSCCLPVSWLEHAQPAGYPHFPRLY